MYISVSGHSHIIYYNRAFDPQISVLLIGMAWDGRERGLGGSFVRPNSKAAMVLQCLEVSGHGRGMARYIYISFACIYNNMQVTASITSQPNGVYQNTRLGASLLTLSLLAC